MTHRLQGSQDVQTLSPTGRFDEHPLHTPQKPQKRLQNKVRRINKVNQPLPRLCFLQTRFQLLGQISRLLLGVGFGRNHSHLAPLQSTPAQPRSHLGQSPFEPGQLEDPVPGLLDRRHRVQRQFRLDQLPVFLQRTDRTVKRQFLELRQPPCLVFGQNSSKGCYRKSRRADKSSDVADARPSKARLPSCSEQTGGDA